MTSILFFFMRNKDKLSKGAQFNKGQRQSRANYVVKDIDFLTLIRCVCYNKQGHTFHRSNVIEKWDRVNFPSERKSFVEVTAHHISIINFFLNKYSNKDFNIPIINWLCFIYEKQTNCPQERWLLTNARDNVDSPLMRQTFGEVIYQKLAFSVLQ